MEDARPPLERESSLSRLNRVLSAGADLTADKENQGGEFGSGKGRFMSSTASSRKKEALAGGKPPVAPVAEDGDELPLAGGAPQARTLSDLRDRLQEAQRRTAAVAGGSDSAAVQLAPRLQAIAEEVLGDPEFVESCNRELHFRTTASQFDYKNIISDYKAHNGRLRKLLATMQSNQEVYIQRALEFEAHVSTHLEQARGAEQVAETTIKRLEAEKQASERSFAAFKADSAAAASAMEAQLRDARRRAKAESDDAAGKLAKAADAQAALTSELAASQATIRGMEAAAATASAAQAALSAELKASQEALQASRAEAVAAASDASALRTALEVQTQAAQKADAEAEQRAQVAAATAAQQLRAAEAARVEDKAAADKAAASAAAALETATAEIVSLQARLGAALEAARAADKAAAEERSAIEARASALAADKAALEAKCSALDATVKSLEAERTRLQGSLERQDAACVALRSEATQAAATSARLESENAALKARCEHLDSCLSRTQGDGRATAEAHAVARAKLESSEAERDKERARHEADVQRLQAELAALQGQHTQLVGANAAAVAEAKAGRERLEVASRQADEAKAAAATRLGEVQQAAERAAAKAAEELDKARVAAAAQVQQLQEAADKRMAEAKASADASLATAEARAAEQRRLGEAALADIKGAAAKAADEAAAALAASTARAQADLQAAEQRAAEQLRAATDAAKAAAAEAAALLADAQAQAQAAAAKAQQDADALAAQLAQAQEQAACASQALGAAEEARAAVEARLAPIVAQLDSEVAEAERIRTEAAAKETALTAALACAEEAARSAAEEAAGARSELGRLQAVLSAGAGGCDVATAERLLGAVHAAGDADKLAAQLGMWRDHAQSALAKVKELEASALEGEAERRRLHNLVQELRGNVRVYCRVRPVKTGEEDAAAVVPGMDGTSVTLAPTGAAFGFDRVFGPESSQEDVFGEVSALVQSALDGYKVCLFSYGQTGSGKTFTMLGGPAGDARGIIPRAVEAVLNAAEAAKAKGWTYSLAACYVEIYNEQVRDLLRPGAAHSDKHAIVHSPEGVTEVSGATREAVPSLAAAQGLVRRAAAARAVEATAMNATSSRSHTVFMLYITGEHAAAGQRLSGCLNLVDLAGSERVGRSEAAGARLKEACAINKSLSSLGDVFGALAAKSSHVPYRNSKLTYLLQPCLGGDGKTLMFVNVAPEADSADESACALRFASMVNACELGGKAGKGHGAKRNLTSIPQQPPQLQAEPSGNSVGSAGAGRGQRGVVTSRPASAPATSSGGGPPAAKRTAAVAGLGRPPASGSAPKTMRK